MSNRASRTTFYLGWVGLVKVESEFLRSIKQYSLKTHGEELALN